MAGVARGFISAQNSPSEAADSLWAALGTPPFLTYAGLLLKHFYRQRLAPQESLLQVEAVPVKAIVFSLWRKEVLASRVLVVHRNPPPPRA